MFTSSICKTLEYLEFIIMQNTYHEIFYKTLTYSEPSLLTILVYSEIKSTEIFKTFAYSEPECVSYSLLFGYSLELITSTVSSTFYKKYDLLLRYSFFQPFLSIWAGGLLITDPIVDIRQNFGYGLRGKWKEKYLYIRKCNNNINNSKKRNFWKKRLVQSNKYLN